MARWKMEGRSLTNPRKERYSDNLTVSGDTRTIREHSERWINPSINHQKAPRFATSERERPGSARPKPLPSAIPYREDLQPANCTQHAS